MSDTSQFSPLVPKWAETTFDQLCRGPMRNLEPPKINNFSSLFINESDSTSKNYSNSMIQPKVVITPLEIIHTPKLKAPKRRYKNRKKKISSTLSKRIQTEPTTLPEDNVILHELALDRDYNLGMSSIITSPVMNTPNFQNTLGTSTPILTNKSFLLNDIKNISNGVKSKLIDKFHLECQVVLSPMHMNSENIAHDNQTNVKLKIAHNVDNYKENIPINNNNNNNNDDLLIGNQLPIVKLERINVDQLQMKDHSSSIIDSSVNHIENVQRKSVKKLSLVRKQNGGGERKSKLHLTRKSLSRYKNNRKRELLTEIISDTQSIVPSNSKFASIKKSFINTKRGGCNRIKKQIIKNCDNDNIIDLTNTNNCDNRDLSLGCELIDNDNIITISSTSSIKHNNSNNDNSDDTHLNHKSSLSVLPDRIYLKPGKQWQRSLSILRRTSSTTTTSCNQQHKGRKWRQTFFEILKDNNKSICLNTFATSNPQTKTVDVNELLIDNQINSNECIGGGGGGAAAAAAAKRISIRIVPTETIPTTKISQNEHSYSIGNDHNKNCKDLEIYARITQNFRHNKGYSEIEKELDSFKDLSLNVSIVNESSLIVLEQSLIQSLLNVNERITAKEIVLKRCNQNEPLDFDTCYPDSVLQKCHKIGEGVYGEVFLLKNMNGHEIVLKIIPIEGTLLVNGEHQKRFDEIISEIIITQELSALRDNPYNCTTCFTYVHNVRCVRGKYPSRLIDLWELYDEQKGSENEHPAIFNCNQLYIVFELEHGGRDLESFEFSNAEQSYSIFIQTALALSIAENQLEFEHRDLHWGNLLIQSTTHKSIDFILNGESIRVKTFGVAATIIDFTLSRVTYENVCIYNNLADEPDLFKSVGDYQFEIYKLMQQKNHNKWDVFEPYTNILWLHYILLKMIDGARYKRTKSLKHTKCLKLMETVSNTLITRQHTQQFVHDYIILNKQINIV